MNSRRSLSPSAEEPSTCSGTSSWGHTAPCTLYACDTCIRQIAFHGRHGNQTRARSRSEQGRAHAAASAGTRHGGAYPPDAYATRDTAGRTLRLLQAPSNGVVSPGRAHRCCFSQYSPNTCCSNSVFALKQCAPAHKTHRRGPTGVAMAGKRCTWRCSATATAQQPAAAATGQAGGRTGGGGGESRDRAGRQVSRARAL